MRRVMITMLMVVFVISSVGGVSAGFDDVAGTEFEGAVGTLSSLGLLQGYPDGTFQPDGPITRAEFAAVAVRALGLDSAADHAKGETMFPDVPATHWASGYINIAVDQGIITGYPDGTFQPSNPVTGAEALAMLVRVLGYDPVVTGSWPTGYLVKAFELGLSAGVQFGSSAPASRGTVALFLTNALSVNLMVPQMVGAIQTYVVSGDTLLDKLGFTTFVGRIVETANVLDTDLASDEVMIDADTYKLAGSLNVDDLLGRKVRAWKAGSTVYVVSALAETIITGTPTDWGCGGVKFGDTWYDWDSDSVLYRNLFRYDRSSWPSFGGAVDPDVMVIVDADDIVLFMSSMDLDVGIIANIEEQFGRITVLLSDNSTWQRRTSQRDFLVTKNGVSGDFADLAIGDVVYYFDESDYLWLWAIDDQVAGEIETVNITATNDIVLVIDGESYVCADDATVSAGLSSFAWLDETSIVDYVGEEVTVHLGRDGKARHVVSEVEVTPPTPITWALVHTAPWVWTGPDGDETFIRLRMTDGTLVRYTVAEAADLDLLVGANTGAASTDIVNLDPGDVVQITFNDDGDIDEIVEPEFDPVTQDIYNDYAFDADNDLFTGLSTYKLLPTTLIFDVNGIKMVSYDAFKASEFADPTVVDFLVDGSFLRAIRLDGGDLTTATPGVVEETGVVLGRRITADGSMVKILVEDTEYEFLIDGTVINARTESNWGMSTSEIADLKTGDLVWFEAAGDVFAEIDEPNVVWLGTYTAYYVKSFDPDIGLLELTTDPTDPGATEAECFVTTDTVIYDVTGTPVMVDSGSLFEGVVVQLFGDTFGIVDFIKIVDEAINAVI